VIRRRGRTVPTLIVALVAVSACTTGALAPAAISPALTPIAANPSLATSGLDADVGADMVVSWSGQGLPASVRSLLVAGQVGGVLLFSSNFSGPAGLRSLSNQLTQLASDACLDHPILVMLDEEGGEVNRVLAPFAPPSQLVAGRGGPDAVTSIERESGAGLRALGVGLNLAPVADVRTNPQDDVIGDRSFGSSPEVVAPLVAAAVEGLHEGGIGATLKHFPGLGGAAGDPHLAIPTDNETEARWEAVQLPSFEAGISAGADAVMTTAVYVPGLGGGSAPAMFSPSVVGRLRTQLQFSGVIMSDSVSLGGVGALYPMPEAAVLALAAGNDLVLLGNGDPGYEAKALAAVRAAVLSGRLDARALHGSAVRVNALRDKWGRPFVHCRRDMTA
jgi:beta-N-acetylhexosaminidase